MKRFASLLASLAILAQLAFATETDDALRRLEDAINQELASREPTENDPGQSLGVSSRFAIARLRSALQEGDAQIDATLSQLSALFTSEAVTRELERLQAALRKERDTREKEHLAEMEAILARAKEIVGGAKEAADLDGLLSDLLAMTQRTRMARLSGPAQLASTRLQAATRFVTLWQDYLAARSANDLNAQRQTLQNLANSEQSDLIPRSQILSAKQAVEQSPSTDGSAPATQALIDSVLAEIQSPEDIGAGLAKLSAMRLTGTKAVEARTRLAALNSMYREFQAGLPPNLRLHEGFASGNLGSAMLALHTQVLLAVLPTYIDAPEGTAPKPGETVIQFLDRVAAEAKERGDIALAVRARAALRSLQHTNVYTDNDQAALRAFVSAENLEAAGQFLLAVMSYQTALKSGSDAVSPKLIGQRLDAIKAAHPDEYEQAMTRVAAASNPSGTR